MFHRNLRNAAWFISFGCSFFLCFYFCFGLSFLFIPYLVFVSVQSLKSSIIFLRTSGFIPWIDFISAFCVLWTALSFLVVVVNFSAFQSWSNSNWVENNIKWGKKLQIIFWDVLDWIEFRIGMRQSIMRWQNSSARVYHFRSQK